MINILGFLLTTTLVTLHMINILGFLLTTTLVTFTDGIRCKA
jgi:hypothetical protein